MRRVLPLAVIALCPLMMIVMIGILIAFPQLALWLPALLKA